MLSVGGCLGVLSAVVVLLVLSDVTPLLLVCAAELDSGEVSVPSLPSAELECVTPEAANNIITKSIMMMTFSLATPTNYTSCM